VIVSDAVNNGELVLLGNWPPMAASLARVKETRRVVRRGDHFLRSGHPDPRLPTTNTAKKKWRVRTPCLFSEPGFAEPDGPLLGFRS
jgi:hypothetical protein